MLLEQVDLGNAIFFIILLKCTRLYRNVNCNYYWLPCDFRSELHSTIVLFWFLKPCFTWVSLLIKRTMSKPQSLLHLTIFTSIHWASLKKLLVSPICNSIEFLFLLFFFQKLQVGLGVHRTYRAEDRHIFWCGRSFHRWENGE